MGHAKNLGTSGRATNLVTSHDASSDFGRAFGFQLIGLMEISTSSEAGLGDITRLVDFIQKNLSKPFSSNQAFSCVPPNESAAIQERRSWIFPKGELIRIIGPNGAG